MGTKYPAGVSPVYPPRDWLCPSCGKYHTKPHFAFPGQVDKKHRPGVEGRVKFNREGADMSCDDDKRDTPIKVMKEATGNQFKQDGNHRQLFCPHCGWLDDIICIVKTTKRRKKLGIF